MVELATVTAAISAATSAVGLIDKMADQIMRFVKGETASSVPPEHRLKIEKEGDAIVSKSYGHVSKRITAQDLQHLPEVQLRHIQVLERVAYHCME